MKSPRFLYFFKSPDEKYIFFSAYTEQKLTVLRILLNNMICTLKSYDCYFMLGRYFDEHQLTETQ